jgi:hypothetical protein
MGGANMRRGSAPVAPVVMAVVVALLAGCASTDKLSDAGLPGSAAQPPLEGFLQQAQAASQQGLHDKSRRTLREAAMAYPAAKEPWLRLAEDYFRQGDYGNAILAAQEVTQRDARHPLAQSVLAVSGLRVSAQALGELRERSSFEVGSRDEAVELTKQMRAHLGEPVLVPVKADPAADGGRTATTPVVRPRPPAPGSRAQPEPAPARSAAPPTPARSAAATPARSAAAPAPARSASAQSPARSAAASTAVKPVAAAAPASPAPVRAVAAAASSAPAPVAKGGNPFKVLD